MMIIVNGESPEHLEMIQGGVIRQLADEKWDTFIKVSLFLIFYFSHCLSMVGLQSSSSMSTDCVVLLKGDWTIFRHAGSGRVGRVWSARKNTVKYSATAGNWTRATGRIDSEIHSPTELSWPRQWEDRQWNSFILPLSYHDPGHREDRQWDTFILPLSYHDAGHREDRQWDSFILPLSYPECITLR